MQVKQAANVVELLEYFARRGRPATLAEISDDLGWPRSSTFNLVGTLADLGFLYEPGARFGYYPGPRWLALAQSIAAAEPLPDAVVALAAEVAAETGETTAIGAPAGTSVLFLHVVESAHRIRYFAQVGDRVPIQASSAGRAILAQYGAQDRQSLYRRIDFGRFTETTPTSIDAVEAKLRRASDRGYHQSLSEFVPDLAGVAVPLPVGQRCMSLIVAGPTARCAERRPQIGAILNAAVRRFAPELGIASREQV